ncbi:hypothetical protein [Paraburkholderia sp. C35]|uniref:hypothetical protein n=1 Tax=Paraburkholderia sp. C35 TaxID=2126993 RepID=UPI000D68F24A|nr:hypothetical protein [Paraburkholderia sp. C35]
MAERVSGPYRGYYISASARLVQPHEPARRAGEREGLYVGSVSLSERGPDDPHRMETLIGIGDEHRFATEDEALAFVEKAGRAYVDRLLDGA